MTSRRTLHRDGTAISQEKQALFSAVVATESHPLRCPPVFVMESAENGQRDHLSVARVGGEVGHQRGPIEERPQTNSFLNRQAPIPGS